MFTSKDVAAERRGTFKKGIDSEQGRRNRAETRVQIRKGKKEENMMKRRMLAPTNTESQAAESEAPESASSTTANSSKKVVTVDDIPGLMTVITNSDSTDDEMVEAVRGFRRMLSIERDPPVSEVLASGVLPYFVHFLGKSDCWLLMFESAWALTNVASTDRTSVVVEAGAVPALISLLKHDMPDLREQVGWCLGNIAGDSKVLRDHLLQQGILEPLLLNMNQPANMSLLNNVTWTVSNLCRGKPGPDLQFVQPAIQPLVELLSKDVSEDVLIDAVWALSYLSDGSDERIQTVLESGVANKLVEFLANKDSQLLTPVVRCLGNFVTGSDLQTQIVIDAGILPHLKALLESPRKAIRKEACWLVSNIAAGTTEQIGKLFSQGGIVKRIVKNAADAPWETRKEALWAVSNICTTGTELQVQGLVQNEGLASLCSILSTGSDSKILLVALDAITRVLEVGERHGKEYTTLMDEYEGITKLENLQEHPNEEVYKKTIKLLERFFSADEDMDDENLAPATTDTGTFSFGVSKQLFPSSTPSFDFGGPNVLGNASNIFADI